jgi:acetyl esterase/lipase
LTLWLTFGLTRLKIDGMEATPADPSGDAPWLRLEFGALPASVSTGDDVDVYPGLIYASPVGFRPLRLDLYRPAAASRPSPLIAWIHGGAFAMGHRGLLPGFLAEARFFELLVEHGFAVATVDYRLSGEAHFPAQLHDVKAAIRWLRARSDELNLDATRVAVWGESAGGHLAAMAGATSELIELEGEVGVRDGSSAVQAVVDWYGPTDFAAMDHQRPSNAIQTHGDAGSPESRLIGATVDVSPELVALANPCTYVRSGLPPFLVAHGTADRLVPFGQSSLLVEALRAAGVPVTFHAVEGADHVFDGAPDKVALVEEALAFLRATLGTGTA